MLDGTDFIVPEGAEWVSRNPEIARVDEQGTVTALREGATTIVAAVKGAVAELPLTVLMNMTGVWRLTFIPVGCPYEVIPGCLIRFTGRRPVTESVTLSQIGNLIEGEWDVVRIEGRIATGVQLIIEGQQCFTSDHTFDTVIAVRWEMQRLAGTDSFSGRARWEQYHLSTWGDCNGTRGAGGIVGDLQILDFRRQDP